MAKKHNTERLGEVTFTYMGTDQEFDEFLKMLVRDYLTVELSHSGDTTD